MTSILFASFLGLAASAQTTLTAKVDSFSFTGRQNTAAEICGHVEGASTVQQILIVSDPKLKAPGKYLILSTPAGEFCAVIATSTGKAEVSVMGSSYIENTKATEFTNTRE